MGDTDPKPQRKNLSATIARRTDIQRTIKGELVIEGDNLKSLLNADQAQQSDYLIEVPLDNGRWGVEIAWGAGCRMEAEAEPQASTSSPVGLDSPPTSLSIFLCSRRDEDERRAGKMLRHAACSLKLKTRYTVLLERNSDEIDVYGADDILSVAPQDPKIMSSLGYDLDLNDIRKRAQLSDKLVLTWEITESENTKLKDKPMQKVKERPPLLFKNNVHCCEGQCKSNDVCFALPPWPGGESCTFLHARQSDLQHLAYFQKAFAFGEASPNGDAEARSGPSQDNPLIEESSETDIVAFDRSGLDSFDDSDDETLGETKGWLRFSQKKPSPGQQVIQVPDFTFRTYHALLEYARSGHVAFAPLRSQYRDRKQKEDVQGMTVYKTYEEYEDAYILQRATPGILAVVCSPKSMYRLANKLDIAELQALALDEFKFQLRTHNVLDEMSSRTVHLHKERLDACTDCIINGWEECSSKDEMMDALQEGLASDIPDVRSAWQKIFRSVGRRNKRKPDEIS